MAYVRGHKIVLEPGIIVAELRVEEVLEYDSPFPKDAKFPKRIKWRGN